MAWTPLPRPDERFRRRDIKYIVGPRERRETAVSSIFSFHAAFNSVSITSLFCILLWGSDSWLRSVKRAVVTTGYGKSYSVNILIMRFMNTESRTSSISLLGSMSIHWIRLCGGVRWMWPGIQINIAVAQEIRKPTHEHLQVTCYEGRDQRPSASDLFAARWACVSTFELWEFAFFDGKNCLTLKTLLMFFLRGSVWSVCLLGITHGTSLVTSHYSQITCSQRPSQTSR